MHVPDGWFDYSRFGSPIDSTRIVAVKTPLKKQFNTGRPASLSGDYTKILRGVPIEEEFTPGQMLELFKEKGWRVGLVLDLTFTNRYYEPRDFIHCGVRHSKIKCPGQIIPPDDIYQRLSTEISEFLSDPKNDGSLVAVHCTHGLNRTGYLICRYLMEKCGYDAETAIKAFNRGRGYNIERENYLKHLRNGCPREDKSLATNRLPLMTSDLSSDHQQGERGGGWRSRGGRRADGDKGRSGEDEVVRGRRSRRKRTISPIQWETAGSQTAERERYHEPMRRDGSQEGPARKRAHYGQEDYRDYGNYWDHTPYQHQPHPTSWRHAHHTHHSHSHEEQAPRYHDMHDPYTDSWTTNPDSHYGRTQHYGGSSYHNKRVYYQQDPGRHKEWERERNKR